MKIALLNDTHFGVRNDSPAFIEYQNKFYDEIFFPYLIENNITTLIHLGDVVDRRKFINFQTAHNFEKKFWKRLWELKIDTHIILGNHDTYYKNTNEVNFTHLIKSFDGVNEPWIYTDAKQVNFDGLDIMFIPWICDENEKRTLETLSNSTAQIAMGHLEVKGFEMHNGVVNNHGFEKENFRRFEKVMSGHFHKKSDDGHIYYLGTQYEMTWSDYKCPKGFHVFDTSTRELERITNPNRMFKKIIYNDKTTTYYEKDVSEYDKKHVKLFVSNKNDTEMFEKFVQNLYSKINIHELTIVEDPYDIKSTVREDILDQGEDTLTFLRNYIDQIDTDLDKDKMKDFMKEVYMEASEN